MAQQPLLVAPNAPAQPPTYNAVYQHYQQPGGGPAPWPSQGQQPQATQQQNSYHGVSDIYSAHVYFALAMILSVMFLFTGIGIVTVLCLVPAIVHARLVSTCSLVPRLHLVYWSLMTQMLFCFNTGMLGIIASDGHQYSERRRHATISLGCIMGGCIIGSLGVVIAAAYLIFSTVPFVITFYFCYDC